MKIEGKQWERYIHYLSDKIANRFQLDIKLISIESYLVEGIEPIAVKGFLFHINDYTGDIFQLGMGIISNYLDYEKTDINISSWKHFDTTSLYIEISKSC